MVHARDGALHFSDSPILKSSLTCHFVVEYEEKRGTYTKNLPKNYAFLNQYVDICWYCCNLAIWLVSGTSDFKPRRWQFRPTHPAPHTKRKLTQTWSNIHMVWHIFFDKNHQVWRAKKNSTHTSSVKCQGLTPQNGFHKRNPKKYIYIYKMVRPYPHKTKT